LSRSAKVLLASAVLLTFSMFAGEVAHSSSVRPWTESKAERHVRAKLRWVNESAVDRALADIADWKDALRYDRAQLADAIARGDQRAAESARENIADDLQAIDAGEGDLYAARHVPVRSTLCIGSGPAHGGIAFYSFRCVVKFVYPGPRWRIYVRVLGAHRFAWRRI
jgi:hypothetical protein